GGTGGEGGSVGGGGQPGGTIGATGVLEGTRNQGSHMDDKPSTEVLKNKESEKDTAQTPGAELACVPLKQGSSLQDRTHTPTIKDRGSTKGILGVPGGGSSGGSGGKVRQDARVQVGSG
ncbi:unnamed protein product, partial [Discosporangium mesarthrocarpum]